MHPGSIGIVGSSTILIRAPASAMGSSLSAVSNVAEMGVNSFDHNNVSNSATEERGKEIFGRISVVNELIHRVILPAVAAQQNGEESIGSSHMSISAQSSLGSARIHGNTLFILRRTCYCVNSCAFLFLFESHFKAYYWWVLLVLAKHLL
jgi:hypothetical protein